MSFRVNIPKTELIFVSDILKNSINPESLEKRYVYCINAKWLLSFKDRDSVPLFSQSLQGLILGYSNSLFLVELSNGKRVRTESVVLAERVDELCKEAKIQNKKVYLNHFRDTFCRTEEEVTNDRQRIIEEQQKKRKLKKGIYHPLVVGKLEAEFETDPFEN